MRLLHIGDAFHDLRRVDQVISDLTMLRPLGFKILLLSLALPGASWALGLGDIHVESALHQPLAAQIEIVGATADSAAGLSAAIADEETFKRYGLERPAGLFSTALTVRQDKLGHPVLVLRSTDTYPEPMVTFLVDLHSPGGELIREYTVLLDPPGLVPEHDAVETASATASQASPTAAQVPATETLVPTIRTRAPEAQTQTPVPVMAPAGSAPAQDFKPTPNTYTVARRDTLARIANIAGAHSTSDRRKMMVAIYRANPGAFQTNLNMLRTGVTLQLPSVAELSKIPAEEANREFAQQMAAWHTPDHRLPTVASAPAAGAARAQQAAAQPSVVNAPASPTLIADSTTSRVAATDAKPNSESNEAETAALVERVKSLEKSLHDIQQDLKQPPVTPAAATFAATLAPAPSVTTHAVAAEESQSDDDEPAPVPHRGLRLIAIAGSLGLALAAGAWIYWIYRRRAIEGDNFSTEARAEPRVELELPIRRASQESQALEASKSAPKFPAIDMSASYLVEEIQHGAEHASATHADAASGDPKTREAATRATDADVPNAGVTATSTSIEETAALALLEEASLAAGIGSAPDEPTVKIAKPRALDAETTAILALPGDLTDDTAAREFAFFNPESANNTTHVTLSGALGEAPKFFAERRKNPVEVLRQAIEREPERSDLRLKLLELYYTAAAQNRRAFLDAVHQLAQNEKLTSTKDWSQITDMVRSIAPDDELFNNGLDKQAVA
jgi:pilus assembly protein FimV